MSENRKKVGILIGTFNPPTLFHTGLAKQTIDKKIVDEVWFVQMNTKIGFNSMFNYIYDMVKCAIDDNPKFKHYTTVYTKRHDILSHLPKENDYYLFICKKDWETNEKNILKTIKSNIVVYYKYDTFIPFDLEPHENVQHVQLDFFYGGTSSSSLARSIIKDTSGTRSWWCIDDKVSNYIKTNKLYT